MCIRDSRINYTMYNLAAFMEGEINELLDALHASDVELRLSEMD